MKHGLRNVLMISFLAVAGIFGVTSTLINKQVEETPVAKRANATSVIGNYIYCSNLSYYKLYAYKGSDQPYGAWPGKSESGSDTGGKTYDVSDKDLSGYTIIFNDGSKKTGDLAYSDTTPFYNNNGAVDANNVLFAEISSPSATLAFTFDDSTGNLTLNTGIINKDATIKFKISNYRSVECNGQSLDDLNKGNNNTYTVPNIGSYTFTCTALAVGTYGDFTYGMTSTFHLPNTVSFTAGDYGSVTSSSIGNVAWGSTVTVSSNTVTIGATTVTANPDSSDAQYTYSFSSWSGVSNGDVITSDLSVTANFQRSVNQYTASVYSNDVNKGTVSGGGTDDYGTSVSLTATPKTGYRFLGWKINGSGSTYASTSNPLSFTLTENVSYTAYFGSANSYIIYFDPGTGSIDTYSDVYLYYLDSAGVYNNAFPGDKLSSTRNHDSFYGGDIHCASIPSDITLLIFSNGDGIQTYNITSGWGDNYTYLLYNDRQGNWHSSSYELTLTDGLSSSTSYVYGDVYITMPSTSGTTPTGYTAEWNTNIDGSGDTYVVGSSYEFTADTSLYRYNRIHKHTVTYHQNDESDPISTKVVSNIDYDTDHTVLSIGTGAGQVGWNHSYLRNFLRWNTKSDGSGEPYLPGSTLHVDDKDITLYSIQQWYTFYCSVDGGTTWHTMTTSNADGYLVQFNPSYSLDLESGEQVLFRYNDGSGEQDFAVGSFSGNYDAEDGVIRDSCQGRVWLKIDDDEEHTVYCYIDEISTTSLVVTHNGSSVAYPMVSDGDNQFVTNGFLYIRQGDELQRRYAKDTYGVYLNDGQGCFSQEVSGEAAQCLYTGAYIIYLRRAFGTTGDMNTIYVKPLSDAGSYVESAAYYARSFLTSTGTVCSNYNSNTASSFSSAWSDEDDNGAEKIFSELLPDVKTGLKSTTYNGNQYVAQMKARYNYILNKYGTDILNDFLETGATSSSAIRPFQTFSLSGFDENSLSTIVIIAASSIALISIASLSILIIKKKKSKEE